MYIFIYIRTYVYKLIPHVPNVPYVPYVLHVPCVSLSPLLLFCLAFYWHDIQPIPFLVSLALPCRAGQARAAYPESPIQLSINIKSDTPSLLLVFSNMFPHSVVPLMVFFLPAVHFRIPEIDPPNPKPKQHKEFLSPFLPSSPSLSHQFSVVAVFLFLPLLPAFFAYGYRLTPFLPSCLRSLPEIHPSSPGFFLLFFRPVPFTHRRFCVNLP